MGRADASLAANHASRCGGSLRYCCQSANTCDSTRSKDSLLKPAAHIDTATCLSSLVTILTMPAAEHDFFHIDITSSTLKYERSFFSAVTATMLIGSLCLCNNSSACICCHTCKVGGRSSNFTRSMWSVVLILSS